MLLSSALSTHYIALAAPDIAFFVEYQKKY